MQKLFRSLIAVGGLAGLAACGDDVSITPPANPLVISGAPVTAVSVGAKVQLSANKAVTWASSAANVASVDGTGLVTAVAAGSASITATSTADVNEKATVTITVTAPAVRNVTVAPSNAILKPGETLGLVANVDADAGVARTVTWASSTPAVATVTAAGVVTAVAPGAATITATSTANTSVSGAASITVRAPIPATISVQNITIAGTAGVTANVNNIVGAIDVNLNVDPGEQVVSRVEVLIDGTVACTQNLSGSQSQALRLAAAFEELEAVIVSCQINTAAFNTTTGVANFFNGPHTLSARAVLVGGTDVATPSTPLIFNNASGVIALITNTNGSDPTTAINPSTGFQWIGGAVTLNFTGVSYVSGTTLASVTCTIFGKTVTVPLTAGIGSVTWTESSSQWSSTNTSVTNYLSSGPESITCASAVLSNGQALIPAPGTTPVLNFGAPGMTNASQPALQVVRLDNTAPGVASANAVAQTALVINPATLAVWVNATTTFGAGSAGIPTQSTINASDVGADAVTVTVYVTNATTTTLTGASGSCNITGLDVLTTGSQLAATTVSTVYQARVVFKDALGNISCQDLAPGAVVSGTFGADFVAPTFTTVSGPAANSGAAAPIATFTVNGLSDNASGFTPGAELRVSIKLDVPTGSSCFIGATSACNPVSSANPVASIGATEGYYTATITLVDQAGNATTVFTGRLYLFDATLPTFSGGISLPSVIAGAATNTFTASVADNLDLNSIFGHVAYPTATIEYPSQSLGSFGLPFELTATANYAVANWIRCINPAGDFVATTNQPTTITLVVSDQASNTASLTSGAFGANAQACGAVGNVLPGELNSFTQSAPVFLSGKTQVDLDGASLASASQANVTLRTVADVDLNVAVDPFTRVDYYYQDPVSSRWIKIGTATSLLQQTLTTRTYTYDFVWDPAAPVPTGAINVQAIGVDAQGDAVLSGVQVVTIVP